MNSNFDKYDHKLDYNEALSIITVALYKFISLLDGCVMLHVTAKLKRSGFSQKELCLRIAVVTCTAFPYVTLHSQPFPNTRLVAVLCYTCYFVPPNGLN